MAIFIANGQDSYVASVIQEQEAGDTDWVKAKPSEISKTSISITGSTNTNTSIWVSGLTNLLYKALLYNSTDGAKTGTMKLTSINGTDGQFDISDFGLTQTPTKGHLIEKTIDLTANIDTTNTTTTQLVLTASFDDPILVRDGYIFVLSNSADGIRYDVAIGVDRTLSSDGANQIYTIDISNFGLTQAPTKVNVIKPFMEISVKENDIGLEELNLPIVAGETTTTKISFDDSGFSDTKKIIANNTMKVDLDVGNNGVGVQIISKGNDSAFKGYPVEFDYYSHWEKQNIAKFTSGISGSANWATAELFPNPVRIPGITVLKNKVYVNEGQIDPTGLYKATIDSSGVVSSFTAQPQGACPSSYGGSPIVTKDRIWYFTGEQDSTTNKYHIYYLRFDENGDIIDNSWQLYNIQFPAYPLWRPNFITKSKIYVFGGSDLYVADIDENGLIGEFTQLPSQFSNSHAYVYPWAMTKTRVYIFWKSGSDTYADYIQINPDGTLNDNGWVVANPNNDSPIVTGAYCDWQYGASATQNKIYFPRKDAKGLIFIDVDNNGVDTSGGLLSQVPPNGSGDTNIVVTKSRLYLIGTAGSGTTEVQYINFDGWDRDKASHDAGGYPYYTFNTLPQAPTKARIRPNPNKILHPESVTYDSANDKITIQYPQVEFINNPARKIQVKWDAPFGGAINEELKVDLWKDY